MISAPAQYLLRFDDLCPTVSAQRWPIFKAMIEEFRLQPILAVVPDNRDPELEVSPPNPCFWDQMRALEVGGAAIGLHGFRHLCLSRGRNLVGLHRTAEFAGVPGRTQRVWIAEGRRILRDHGLHPNIWVAPRHGFDAQTICALLGEGIHALSDGFARVPFLRDGITWIPQQLWGPVEKDRGLWTICVHPNTASDADIEVLRAFLLEHASRFTSVDRALCHFQPAALTLAERAQAECALRRLKVSHTVGRIRRSELWRRRFFRSSNSA
jgi:predicted deacetylase